MQNALDVTDFGRNIPGYIIRSIIALTRLQRQSWVGKRIAFVLRWIGLRFIDSAVDIEAMGAKMRLYPFRNVCEKRILFTPQYFDRGERELIISKLRPNFVFLDIGANIGGYALAVAAAADPSARIIAIEPQPEIFDRLAYNIAQNRFGTVKAIACALGDKDGEVTLFVNASNLGEASIKLVASAEDRGRTIRVMSRTLLTLAADEGLTHIDAAKLDVEGAEDLVLIPFLRKAPRDLWPKLILIENPCGRWQHDLHALLVERGYRRCLSTRMNAAFERD